MTSIKTAIIAMLVVMTTAGAALADCTYPTDMARDGSWCGDRASTVRPGGK